MYKRWWAVPGLLFCVSTAYFILLEVFQLNDPRRTWTIPRLMAAALFLLAGLALRRLCTRRAILLGAGVLLLPTLLLTALQFGHHDFALTQFYMWLGTVWEMAFGVFQHALFPRTFPLPSWLFFLIPALFPFLWVPFGKAEP